MQPIRLPPLRQRRVTAKNTWATHAVGWRKVSVRVQRFPLVVQIYRKESRRGGGELNHWPQQD